MLVFSMKNFTGKEKNIYTYILPVNSPCLTIHFKSNRYKVFCVKLNRTAWNGCTSPLRAASTQELLGVYRPGLGEHLGQYITIIKFQGSQEAESSKNWNLMAALLWGLMWLSMHFLAVCSPEWSRRLVLRHTVDWQVKTARTQMNSRKVFCAKRVNKQLGFV